MMTLMLFCIWHAVSVLGELGGKALKVDCVGFLLCTCMNL